MNACAPVFLEASVQQFYAYRIYLLNRNFPYLPAAICASSLAAFGSGSVFCKKTLEQPQAPVSHFQKYSVPTLSCKVLCDLLITVGMVYTLLSKRTQVRRTNNVLKLLSIYMINCGTLNLVSTVCCLVLLVKYPSADIYILFFFIMTRLNFCGFMAILNTRDSLRETLEGPDNAVLTFSHLKAHIRPTVPKSAGDTTGISNNMARQGFPPASSDTTHDASMIVFNRDKYAAPDEVATYQV
ncbi:hypothetical protein BJV78DRAFT_1285288 [Lactifluus subvellereus]|nr:hypothetical protein BJV78DRAFT_1285288 [Lactifluus subvellereus]